MVDVVGALWGGPGPRVGDIAMSWSAATDGSCSEFVVTRLCRSWPGIVGSPFLGGWVFCRCISSALGSVRCLGRVGGGGRLLLEKRPPNRKKRQWKLVSRAGPEVRVCGERAWAIAFAPSGGELSRSPHSHGRLTTHSSAIRDSTSGRMLQRLLRAHPMTFNHTCKAYWFSPHDHVTWPHGRKAWYAIRRLIIPLGMVITDNIEATLAWCKILTNFRQGQQGIVQYKPTIMSYFDRYICVHYSYLSLC